MFEGDWLMDREKYCANLIFESASGLFDKVKAKDLIDDLKLRAAEKGGVNSGTIDEATLDLLMEKETAHARAKVEAYINLMKEDNIKNNYIDRFKSGLQGLNAVLDGIQSNIKNARFSTAAIQKQVVAKYMGQLTNLLNKDDLLPMFKDRTYSLNLAKALKGEAQDIPKIDLMAQHIKSVYKNMRDEARTNGVWMGDLKDFGARQTHDVTKLLTGGMSLVDRTRLLAKVGLNERRRIFKENWMNTIYPLLDLERTFKDTPTNKIMDSLSNIYDSFISGDHYKPAPQTVMEDVFAFKNKGALGKKMAAHRVLHFKDAESWSKYNDIYGIGSIQEGVVDTIKGMSNNIGLVKMWGTNPERMFDKIVSYIKDKDPHVNKFRLKHAKDTFAELTGSASIPESNGLARFGSAMRAWSSMSHLGLVLPTSFNDLAIRASMLVDEHGIGYLEAWKSGIQEMLPGFTDKEHRMILDSIGTWSEAQFGHAIRYFSANDSPTGTITKNMELFFKAAGMTDWDRIHKQGVSSILSRYMALRRDTKFADLPSSEQNTMRIYGLEEKEWDLIRHPDNVQNPYGAKKMIAPDAAQYFTKESIAEYLGQKSVSEGKIKEIKNDIETRLRTYFIDQVDHAILTPSASDRAFIHFGSRPGTVLGELARFAGQFKTFGIAMTRRVGGRIMLRHDYPSAAKAYIGFAVAGTALGYISNLVKDLAKGISPAPPDTPQTWMRAIDVGVSGILGQMLFNSYQKFGTDLSTQLAGPVAGTANDLMEMMYKIGTWNHPGIAALNFAQRNTPFANLWFMNLVMKATFLDEVKEDLNPGYKRRVQNNLKKYGQHLIY